MPEITEQRIQGAIVRYASVLMTNTEFTDTQRKILRCAFREALRELFRSD